MISRPSTVCRMFAGFNARLCGGAAGMSLSRAWFAMGEIIASNGNETRALCNSSSEEVLESSEPGVKRRSALRDRNGWDERYKSDEGQVFGKRRLNSSEDSVPDAGREHDPPWHLPQLGSCRLVPHRTAAISKVQDFVSIVL